jgi:hypothetical protein
MGVDAPRHRLLDFQHRHPDGVGERQGVGAAVALDHDTLQAEQAGAVVATGIDPRPKARSTGKRDQPASRVSRFRLNSWVM